MAWGIPKSSRNKKPKKLKKKKHNNDISSGMLAQDSSLNAFGDMSYDSPNMGFNAPPQNQNRMPKQNQNQQLGIGKQLDFNNDAFGNINFGGGNFELEFT